MRFSVPLLTLAGTVAGTAAAVVAYQATAGGAPATSPASVSTDRPAPVRISWLPCEPGWKVEGASCVRVRERVIVVRDLPAPAAPAAPAAPQIAAHSSTSAGHDDAGEDDSAEPDEATEDAMDEETGDHPDDDGVAHEDVGDD